MKSFTQVISYFSFQGRKLTLSDCQILNLSMKNKHIDLLLGLKCDHPFYLGHNYELEKLRSNI